jgi:hypothetical protein
MTEHVTFVNVLASASGLYIAWILLRIAAGLVQDLRRALRRRGKPSPGEGKP